MKYLIKSAMPILMLVLIIFFLSLAIMPVGGLNPNNRVYCPNLAIVMAVSGILIVPAVAFAGWAMCKDVA